MNIFHFRARIYVSPKYLLVTVVQEVVLIFLSCGIFEAMPHSYRVTIFEDFVVTTCTTGFSVKNTPCCHTIVFLSSL